MTDSADSGGQEIWRFQDGANGSNDFAFGVAAAPDGGVVMAGSTQGDWNAGNAGEYDLAVAKIDSGGNLVWAWQEGSAGDDYLNGVVALEDGSVVVAGYVNGTWNGEPSIGADDFAAVKLDSDGTVVWRWREGTVEIDKVFAAVATADGNIVLSGYTYGDFGGTQLGSFDAAAVKLDTNGQELWRYQAGTSTDGVYIYASAARPDGSVVLAGTTYGSWSGDISGTDAITDFMAVALDGDGQELWRWQDGIGDGDSRILGAMALADGSVVLGGSTEGDWNATNKGSTDFAAVKLDIDGVEEWRYQDGTIYEDEWESAVAGTNGSIILAGFTDGSWMTTSNGGGDFAALSLDAAGTPLWSYQAGTVSHDDVNAAAVRADGTVLLAGWSEGSWVGSDSGDDADMAAVLIDTAVSMTPAPAIVIQPSPVPLTLAPTVAIQAPLASQTPPPTADVQRVAPVAATAPSSSSTSSAAVGSIVGGVLGGAGLFAIVAVVLRKRQVASRKDRSSNSAAPQVSHNDGVSSTAPADRVSSQRSPVPPTEADIAPVPPAGDALRRPPPDYFDSEPPPYIDAIRL